MITDNHTAIFATFKRKNLCEYRKSTTFAEQT